MNGIVIFAGLILFLWLGRSILIPLLVAAFLWYLTNAISDYYRKIFPYKNPTTKSEKIYFPSLLTGYGIKSSSQIYPVSATYFLALNPPPFI